MKRRGFFAAAAAAVVGLIAGGPFFTQPAPSLRVIRRYSYETDTWTRVRMYELRKGDVFEIEDLGVQHACADPTKDANGMWEILSDDEIDPATNRWRSSLRFAEALVVGKPFTRPTAG